MVIINENDEMIEVDDEGTPVCPDCGENCNSYDPDLLFSIEDSDGELTDAYAEEEDLPVCETCSTKHPIDNCFVCRVRERMPSKYDGMMSAPLCRDCMRKRKMLLKSGLNDDAIFCNFGDKERVLNAIGYWKTEFELRRTSAGGISKASIQTYNAMQNLRGGEEKEDD